MMKKKCTILFFALLSFALLHAQEKAEISAPFVSVLNKKMTIQYNLIGCKSNDYYNIRLLIFNSSGDTIQPVHLNGDIGGKVNCGYGKKIEWDIAQDNLQINDELEIQLTGNLVIPPSASSARNSAAKSFSRANIMVSSFFIPGLGQKKASGKGGHLWLSVLAFGSAGTAIYYYQMHTRYYNDYVQSDEAFQRNEFYDKSTDCFNKARYFLYGTDGVWTLNMIWAAVIPISKKSTKQSALGFTVLPGTTYSVFAKWTF